MGTCGTKLRARALTVSFCFSTNSFCLSTASELMPTMSTFVRLKRSFSARASPVRVSHTHDHVIAHVPARASRNWHASFVQPKDPASA